MAQDPSLRRMDSPPVDQQNRKKATVFAQSRDQFSLQNIRIE
jgi:hypothetical protein